MTPGPLIIGHRGASCYAPENTLAALKLAIDQGVDGVEFDVQLANDGVPVVIHDPDLRRLAGLNVRVSQLTSIELAEIDVGSWFNTAFPQKAVVSYSNETVPSLERVMEALADFPGTIYIELKTAKESAVTLVKKVSELIYGSSRPQRLVVKSFDLGALRLTRRFLPELQTAALFEPRVHTVIRSRANLVQLAADCGAGEISLHWSLAGRRIVEAAQDREMSIVVWTVDHPKWVEKARKMGVGSLITNDPIRLLSERERGEIG